MIAWLIGSPGKFTLKKSSRLTYSSQACAEAAPEMNRASIAGIRATKRMNGLPKIFELGEFGTQPPLLRAGDTFAVQMPLAPSPPGEGGVVNLTLGRWA